LAKRTTASDGGDKNAEATDRIEYVLLSQETRRRYLNYAMSVITSRALPDVRDGLKPVQRRILYAMHEDLHLASNGKTLKCAKISGQTMGDYHPHGEMAIYDALVRMAQDFSLRYPLVHGQGNFGSIMGLPAAASRYTEAKLTPVSENLLQELRFQTVDKRPNYDARTEEPVVLPARFPNLLVNGASGIAVGMATNIPTHNLGEVIAACIHLIENPDAETKDLLKHIKGPDFPLGGRIVTDRKDLRGIYEEGRGAIKVRGEWTLDKSKKDGENRVIIHSIPYGVETGNLAAEIGEIVNSRKLPQLIDSNDETDSKHALRIVLELKPGSDPEPVMTYLYKHTSLEQNFGYNATCLVPDDHGTMIPARLSLAQMLNEFLKFRLKTVRRRLEYDLRQLEQRIHLLEGFAIIFNDLDRALKIIRNSSGKRDACDKLLKTFPLLDEPQTMSILEMQLYKISQLEINSILGELSEKKAAADKIRKLLASEKRLWNLVQTELQELSDQYADKRRTAIGSSDEIVEFDASAYIVRENTNVVLTRDGWIKRVGRLQNVETTRVRDGDVVLDVLPGSTLDNIVYFASDGIAYTLPIEAIPVSSGYGEPISKHVKMGDGVGIVAAISTDARFTPSDQDMGDDLPPAPYFLALTSMGQIMRLPLAPFRQPSTKAGRKYCRLLPGDRVVWVELVRDATSIFVATQQARVTHFAMDDVPILSGAGKGVRGIKLADAKDHVLGGAQMARPSDCLRVNTSADKTLVFGQLKYEISSRGGKGIRAAQRSTFTEIIRPEIQLVDWAALEAEKGT